MKRILFLNILLFAFFNIKAQNSVTIQILVQPPYSSHIEDYTSYENKLVMILTGQPNANMQPYQVYFKGFLQGDNGVRVETDDNYKPPQPVEIPAGGSISFNGSELDFFSSEHMTITGTNAKSIILSDGLPEGYYHICIRAFDYDTDQPLSGDEPIGCSQDFGIFHIDPPQVISPLCGDNIMATESQNIVFSWTIPVNSPLNTQYTFTLTELQEGQDPNDAANAMVYPPFFETNTSTNSYVYSMADPSLEKGKTYIIQIRAFDPNEKTEFKNDGYSEICTFTYGKKLKLFDPVDFSTIDSTFQIDSIIPPSIDVTPKFVTTKVCGKIQYNYPELNDISYPMNKANIKLIVDYTFDPNGEQKHELNVSNYDTGIPSGYVLATTKTAKDGSYCFEFINNIKLGQVADYISQNVKMFTPIPVFRVLRIEIEAPHSEFYETYSYNSKIINTGEQNDAVDFDFKVKSFDLDVKLDWNDLWVKMFKAEGFYNTGNLVGAPVYLLRKKSISVMGSSPFPQEDGWPKEYRDNAVYLDLPDNMKLVANTATDDQGIAHFSNLVLNTIPLRQYYIYVAPSESNINNFKPFGPRLFSIQAELNKANSADILENYQNPENFTEKISLDQEFPMITGTIYDEDNNHTPIENVKLTLDEIYVADNGDHLKYKLDPANIFETELDNKLKNQECFCLHHVYRFNFFGTSKDGKFKFRNLALLHTPEKLKDNIAIIKVDKPGYELAEQDGRLSSTALTFKKQLRMGEKMNIVITMKRGAKIRGRIVDGETQQPISDAKVMIIPDQIAETTNELGEFYDYPALKLPGKEQLLVIEKTNYGLDTFKVVIDKSNQDLGTFKLFKLKRRLVVQILDKNTKKPINGALVAIKDVSTSPCFFGNCPLKKTTKGFGLVNFSFDNAAEQYEILVTVPSGLKNYESQSVTVNIPLSTKKTILKGSLSPATCIKGKIYAGKGDNIPVNNAIVKEKQSSSGGNGQFSNLLFSNSDDTLSVLSDSKGYYYKRNVPLGLFKKTYIAAKAQSQYIGDKWDVILKEPRDTNNCIVHDFHLTIYDDMDITHLLGFPIYISDLKSISPKKAEISGGFININSNNQFKIDKNTELEFGKITISAGQIAQGDTLPQAIPSKLPVMTDKNSLDIFVKEISAVFSNKKGIAVAPKTSNSHFGVISGKVKLKQQYFNINNITLPEIYIVGKDKKTEISAFSADKSDKDPLGSQKRIPVAAKNGQNLKYTLFGFHNVEAISNKSGIENKTLVLNSVLHSDIKNIYPKDIKLNIGDIIIGKDNIAQIKGTKELNIKLDKWSLKSTDWIFNADGLILNKGFIDAKGFQLKYKNFRIKENQLDGTLATFQFEDVRLLGIKKLNIVSKDAGFSYVNVQGNNMAYQIDLKKNLQYDYCAYIDHLPGLKPNDKIAFPFILLRSDGNSQYPIDSKLIKLYDLVNFRPDANTLMDVTSQLFQIHGNIILNYPKVNSIATNISFQNENGQLRFGLNATNPINFTTNGLVTRLNNIKLSQHLLTASGTVEEPGTFPSVKVVLTHTPDKIQVDIKENEKIKISDSNYFSDVIGEMHVTGTGAEKQWSTFWFEGYPMGMKGISDNNPKKMKFTVNGVVTATGQEISVKKVDTPFGDMEFSYNLPKSELTGYCEINKTVGGVGLKGGVETIVSVHGWIFKTTGTVTVPSFGEISLFGLLGAYDGTAGLVDKNMGGFSCLPPPFRNKISGFLIAGYFQRNLFDPIDYDFELVKVKAGLDVGLAARFYTSFEDSGTLIGLGLKLYGHAYFEGTLKATCTNVKVYSEAMIGINSQYNTATKFFNFDGCAGLSLTLRGEQCLGTAGLCPESACVGVDIGTIAISAKITGDSDGDLDFSLQKKHCNDCD